MRNVDVVEVTFLVLLCLFHAKMDDEMMIKVNNIVKMKVDDLFEILVENVPTIQFFKENPFFC
jgi:hypothetical protein